MTSIFKQAATQSRKLNLIQSIVSIAPPQSKVSRLGSAPKSGRSRSELKHSLKIMINLEKGIALKISSFQV